MPRIALKRVEVNRFSRTPWEMLTIPERKWVAAAVLRSRSDTLSQKYAFYVESNNPNFKDFVLEEDLHA